MLNAPAMPKTLIIAEKPSVATDLSRVLGKIPDIGKFEKKGKDRNTYFENDSHVITSAVGHLVQLKMPMGPNGKNLPWKFDVLPAVPKRFELEPIEQSEARLKQVLRLARRKDVDTIVNACDAGREGELIFRYIMEIGGIEKPIKRLWMQSMTDNSIKQAWSSLRDDSEMQNLSAAAKCRSESDWLVGLNSTRALTCFRSRHGGFNITAAGRVQTPTLAILARREREIRDFIPEAYCEVHGTFGVSAGQYEGRWIDPDFKKSAEKPHGREQRIWSKETAQMIVDRCTGKTGTVTEQTKPAKQIAPQLYDLTTLQREAPFSAKQTLQIAQALYERHKMLTYPRTDSRYLPEDYVGQVKTTLGDIAKDGGPLSGFAKHAIDKGLVKASKRVFNNAKISDHHAIIPTGRFVKISDAEAKLFDMVVKRTIAVFFPSAEFENTKRFTVIDHGGEKDTFRTDGRVLVTPGWLEVYGRRPGVAGGKDELVSINSGENATADEILLHQDETRPPARYTESTLLSAMEGAGKLVDDEELREAMADRGLGTPATRAATIEGLISQKYIAREARELYCTGKGLRLIEVVDEIGANSLASPSMTGDWEAKLRQMEQGKLDRPTFMRGIIDYTADIVESAKKHAEALKNRSFPDLEVPCPICGAQGLRQTDATFECREMDCKFKGKKHIAGRELSEKEAAELYTKKFVGPLTGFRSRFNKPFDAALELDEKFKVNFVFEDDPSTNVELTEDMVIATIPLVGGGDQVKVYESEKAYHVPDFKTKKDPDGVRIGKTILSRTIPNDEVLKLLAEGKTSLLQGFISNRTKRKFGAYLTLNPEDGKVGFEFEPRAAKKGAKKSAKKAAKKKAKE